MQQFCFFFITFGLFISSNALAMHAGSPTQVSSTAEPQALRNERQPLDLLVTPSQEQNLKVPLQSQEQFSHDQPAFPSPAFDQGVDFLPPLKKVFTLGAVGGPWKVSPLYDFLPVAPPPKPVIREGIVLPKVDLAHLGISDFFRKFGVSLGEYDFPRFKFDLQKIQWEFKLSELKLRTLDLSALLAAKSSESTENGSEAASASSLGTTFDLSVFKPAKERFAQTAISDLTNEQIILLFKDLTSFCFDAGDAKKLEDLLRDARARRVILETSRGSENIISKAVETADLFDHKGKLKTLIAAEDFVEHLARQPVDEKGETTLSKALLHAVYFRRSEVLTLLFQNQKIVEHLSSIPDREYQSVVMKALIVAVILPNRETLLTAFYESSVVFSHLVSCFSRGATAVEPISKTFTKVGLLSALSERAAEKIDRLLHEGVESFMREDAGFVTQVMKKAIKDRNPYLARKLLVDLKLVTLPLQIKEAIEVSAIWESLSDENKRALLTIAQTMYPQLTEEMLIGNHKQMRAYEHAIVGHPSVVDDMEAFGFEGLTRYRDLLAESSHPIEREAQKKALEREFLRRFPAKTAPWFHAETEAAYDLRMFGQGAKALVVELDVLPERQREGLLRPHLGEQTTYTEKAAGICNTHNIGVTSLVAQMAPLAVITSTSTSHLKEIATHITAGKYPFLGMRLTPQARHPMQLYPLSLNCR